ncbi:MAG: hypothetical protein AB1696_15355 [Planctomycetota bacterium]
MAGSTYERILHEAELLSKKEQLLLIERLAERLRILGGPRSKRPRLRWEDLAGSAPCPMCGEDAQAWVARTRRESDKSRRGG